MDTLFSKWVVLTAGCFVNLNAFGILLTFGSLFVPLMEKFEQDRASTATVQSLFMGVMMVTGMIWSMLSRKIGLSKLVLTGSWLVSFGFIVSYFSNSIVLLAVFIGVFSGVGVSIMYTGSSIAIERAFVGEEKGLALAIHQLCIGLGSLGYPFLLDFLLDAYQISGTLLIVGGINLNNIAVALVIYFANKPTLVQETVDKEAIEMKAIEDTHISNDSCCSNLIEYIKTVSSFMLTFQMGAIVIATSVSVAALNGFLVIVLDMFASKGFTSKQGLDSFTAFNSGHVLGKIIIAIFQFKIKLNPIIICMICCCCGCVGQVFIEIFSNIYLVYVGSALSGLAIGAIIAGAVLAFLSVAPPGRFDEAFGITLTTIGIISSAAGPLYGWLRDDLQSYTVGNILTASLLAACALLFLATLCFGKSRPNHPEEKYVVGSENHAFGSDRL